MELKVIIVKSSVEKINHLLLWRQEGLSKAKLPESGLNLSIHLPTSRASAAGLLNNNCSSVGPSIQWKA